MLSGNIFLTHPAHTIVEDITDTLLRIIRLYDLVEDSLPVIQKYQCIRYSEFKSLNIPEPVFADTESFYDTLECDPSEILNDDFHDAYYYPPILPECFFLIQINLK